MNTSELSSRGVCNFKGRLCSPVHAVATKIAAASTATTSNTTTITIIFTRTTLASAGNSCLSLLPSVTSWCSTETTKHSITQTTPNDIPWSLVFCCWKSRQNSFGVTLNGGAKCRWSSLNADAVADNWATSDARCCQLVSVVTPC